MFTDKPVFNRVYCFEHALLDEDFDSCPEFHGESRRYGHKKAAPGNALFPARAHHER